MSPLRQVSALTAKPGISTLLITSLEVTEQDIGRWLVTLISEHRKQQEEGRKKKPGRSLLATKYGLGADFTRRMLCCKCQVN